MTEQKGASVTHGLEKPPWVLRLRQPPEVLRPSLELPVCLFPHRRLAKQQGPPTSPMGQIPLNPQEALI